ncbi:MAG: TRAP transporter large permease [Alphaproteobacteria bacterium]
MLILLLAILATLIIGVPVAFGMGLAGASWILFVEGMEPGTVARRIIFALDSFPLLAIPLFIMMGHLAERAGMLPEMVRWLQMVLGRLRGGMAYLNVLASMLFAGISGTAVSDVASLGRVEIQMMTRAGYPVLFAAALTAASSIAGPIIPPSVAMIIYALAVSQVSIGGLFMAGAIPGLMISLGLLAMCGWHARRHDYGILTDMPDAGSLARQTLRTLPLFLLPVIVVGGIVGGVFTITESAAIGVAYTILIGFFLTRALSPRDLYDATIYSAAISSVVGMLLGAGALLSWILTINRVTNALADGLVALTADPTLFLALVALALLLLGMLMDAVPIIIALAPLLAPIARLYGIDDLQFALVFILSAMIGLVTPPVGIVLFMTSGIAGVPPERLSLAILPFVAWMIAVVALIVTLPMLTLWLPRLLGF